MVSSQADLVGLSTLLVIVEVTGLSLQPRRVQISFSSMWDKTMSYIKPYIALTNRCEAVKSFFGLTYEQMSQKNQSDLYDSLHIDLITKDGNVKYNLTEPKILKRKVDEKNSVVILVHGFMESSEGDMVKGLAPEYLKKSEVQLLALDVRNVITLEYFRASTYVRFIGEKLGLFLSQMIESGQNASKVTLVGHSLGAHIAGIAGQHLQQLIGQKVQKIVALDPAAPCFASTESPGRIGRGDAEYVEVVHTNGGLLGLAEPIGDSDFYPNGGTSQPGCILATCDHSRAWQLYAEAINAPKQFPARKCETWNMFREGQCSKHDVVYMGAESATRGVYFLTTASSSPYGLGAAGSAR